MLNAEAIASCCGCMRHSQQPYLTRNIDCTQEHCYASADSVVNDETPLPMDLCL